MAFEEKPARPKGMPDDPEHALVSMGNYLFSRQALVDALLADARRSTDHDFGRSIIPELVPTGRVYAYDVQLVSPSVASAATTSLVIGMAVFGGLGTIWGPVLGALLLFAVGEGLRFVGVVYNLIAVGLVIMVFVIFLPRGLAGLRRSP